MHRLSDWPLPTEPYVPGQSKRPDQSPAFEVAAQAPKRTDPAQWHANIAFLYGIDLYHTGFFWEAHEVWEPVWMNAAPNSPARALTQALIQLANACLKIRMGRAQAALRLLRISAAAIPTTDGRVLGLDPSSLQLDIAFFESVVSGAIVSDTTEDTSINRPSLKTAL